MPTSASSCTTSSSAFLNVEQPYTFLFIQKAVTAVSRRFHGVEVLPIGRLRPLDWWVPKAQQKYTAQLTP